MSCHTTIHNYSVMHANVYLCYCYDYVKALVYLCYHYDYVRNFVANYSAALSVVLGVPATVVASLQSFCPVWVRVRVRVV